jgi:hypothetical protein
MSLTPLCRLLPHQSPPPPPAGSVGAVTDQEPSLPSGSSAFRNVSACNHCRLHTNRCGHLSQLGEDRCEMCWLSYGPISKGRFPEVSFFITDPVLVLFAGYLETRLASLELAFHPLQTLLPRPRSRPVPTTALGIYVPISTVIVASSLLPRLGRALVNSSSAIDPEIKREPQGGLEDKKIDNLVLESVWPHSQAAATLSAFVRPRSCPLPVSSLPQPRGLRPAPSPE